MFTHNRDGKHYADNQANPITVAELVAREGEE